MYLTLLLAMMFATDPSAIIESAHSKADFALTADPHSKEWRKVRGVTLSRNYLNQPIAGRPTEVRSRWTDGYLYLLYICPFDELNLKSSPTTAEETPRLWNWDVGEAFIGSDFEHITQYKELQVSPQGEWVDLDIDRDNPKPDGGAGWNSGYTVKARIDEKQKIWYGEMKIPFNKLMSASPKKGTELRIGLYRIAGRAPNRQFYAWRPTGEKNFHVPKAFGTLRLR